MTNSEPRRPVVVVIPARGGSKGIPRKNLAYVAGHPLVGRAILAAQGAELVDTVIVSTDDSEIADASRRYGAGVVMRPSEISGDTASSETALLHAIDSREQQGKVTGTVVLLQCTAPFTNAADIDGTIAPVLEGRADSCFAASAFKHFVWQQDSEGTVHGANHDGGPRQRRQDLSSQYLEAGSVYAVTWARLKDAGHRFAGEVALHEVEAARVYEIDTPDELEIARQMAPTLDQRELRSVLPDPVEAVAFDFDGVFTDNSVIVDEDGKESICANRSDGLGIQMLREAGIPMMVISKERNKVVKARCKKLGLPVVQEADDKLTVLKRWLEEHGLSPDNTVYVGNDVNDIECLRFVGCGIGPADSHPDITAFLKARAKVRGGLGVVRLLADEILRR